MNKFQIGIALIAVSGGFVACNDENPWVTGDGEGRIAPNIIADPSVKDVAPQLRAGEDGFPVPTVADLALKLTKADGTFSQSWESSTLFPTDKNFNIGAYKLEASWGDAQTEGFECPYFYGSADFNVAEDEVAEPSVTARLANTMVSVDYTEDFLNYFKTYSTQLHSEGGDFITIIPGETRPAFLRPGNVTVTMNITKQNGVSATIEPAKFEAKAQHHYHLTFDVNGGETGDAQLVVNFDESITTEDVVIDLSDDLMLSPEPKVTAQGFTPDVPVEIVEGSAPENHAAFIITALGGLNSVTLTTESSQLISMGFPAEIDLMAATEAQKALLTQFGLDVKGLWRNPDKMASIDFTDLLGNTKGAGTHKFTLVVRDKLMKVNLPVSAVYTTETAILHVTSAPSVAMQAATASVTVDYNGTSADKNIQIESLDNYGVWNKCEIISASALTRATDSYKLTFHIPADNNDIKIRLKYKGVVKDETTISRSGALLKVVSSADIWATHAALSIVKSNSTPYSSLKFYISKAGGSYTAATASIDEASAKVTITGLTPGTAYSIKASDTGNYVESYPATTFTTESALQLPNSGMETWYNKAGGSNWSVWFPGADESAVWGTMNPLTTSGGIDAAYTRPCGTLRTTGRSGYGALIRTIGWGSGTTAAGAISVIKNISAGLLHLGSAITSTE